MLCLGLELWQHVFSDVFNLHILYSYTVNYPGENDSFAANAVCVSSATTCCYNKAAYNVWNNQQYQRSQLYKR